MAEKLWTQLAKNVQPAKRSEVEQQGAKPANVGGSGSGTKDLNRNRPNVRGGHEGHRKAAQSPPVGSFASKRVVICYRSTV